MAAANVNVRGASVNDPTQIPMMKKRDMVVVSVTPEIAQQWLTFNTSNRQLTQRKVDEFKSDMEAGRWLDDGASIRFAHGKLLDGQHRYRACVEVGVSPRFDEYVGSDPAGFVASSCVHRSLNPSQRALIAAGFLAYEREQARLRMSAGGGDKKSGVADLPHPISGTGKARDIAGQRMGVGGRTVLDAAAVLEKGTPEVVEKVRAGEMALNEAKVIVTLNPKAQRQIVATSKKERADSIRKALNLSNAAKARTQPRQERVPPSDANTAFARKFLGGLERLALMCAEDGMKDGGAIAAKLLEQIDWLNAPMALQFERCQPVIRALAIVQQQRLQAAA